MTKNPMPATPNAELAFVPPLRQSLSRRFVIPRRRLLLYDALDMRFRELKLRKNADCPVCGDHPTITKLINYQEFCGIVPHEAAATEADIDPVQVKAMIDRREPFVSCPSA
jgi:hypothetical protein